MITLITATGSRPEAWALCQKYMYRQTTKEFVDWYVVYDSEAKPLLLPHPDNFKVRLIQGQKLWRPGINTQRPNLDTAIQALRQELKSAIVPLSAIPVFVIEDDDWYAATYLETMLFFLQKFPFVGQANSRYYNVAERSHRQWLNYQHASLCETAFHANQLDVFERGVNSGDLFMDCSLWRIVKTEKIPHLLFDHLGLVCGIKGLPGRQGIGAGHTPDPTFTRDPGYRQLFDWVGNADADNYVELVRRSFKK